MTVNIDGKLFDNVDPKTLPPDLLPFYKMMEGQFTKKMQEIASTVKEAETIKEQFKTVAEERDTLGGQVKQLGDAVTKLKSVNEEWDAWYQKNYDPETGKARASATQARGFEYEGDEGNADDNAFLADGKVGKKGGNMDNKTMSYIKTLEEKVDSLSKAQKDELSQLKKSYNFFLQLDGLKNKHGRENVNDQLVIQTALEKGIDDLDTAYRVSHEDKIIEAKVKEQVEARVKEELEKQKSSALTGEGAAYPLTYHKPEGIARNYEEAREQAANDLGIPVNSAY